MPIAKPDDSASDSYKRPILKRRRVHPIMHQVLELRHLCATATATSTPPYRPTHVTVDEEVFSVWYRMFTTTYGDNLNIKLVISMPVDNPPDGMMAHYEPVTQLAPQGETRDSTPDVPTLSAVSEGPDPGEHCSQADPMAQADSERDSNREEQPTVSPKSPPPASLPGMDVLIQTKPSSQSLDFLTPQKCRCTESETLSRSLKP
ncbi:hypothetical protein FQN54_008471 [Arachnomyces sp. PD_36]|nr:hypothetical protein FQN54_008471 [Arachnomyces sp. PD_36]